MANWATERTCTLVLTVAFKAVAYLKITYGEYTARCECCTTFRNTPEGVLPKAHYDNKVLSGVGSHHQDGMSIERILESFPRVLAGTVLGVRVQRAPRSGRRSRYVRTSPQGSGHFSGTLCVDELHLGRFTLLLATDPLSDLPVAFALVAAIDHDHMCRFLKNLKIWGLEPRVVVTDGSNLYPAVISSSGPGGPSVVLFHVIRTSTS